MSKPNFKQLFNTAKMFTSKHSPEILTGFGIAGVVTTTVLAVKATPKAIRLIEIEEAAKDDALTKKEIVKVAWKCYIPTIATGVFSISCLIGATSVNAKRNAALAAAYKLSEAAIVEYREKVVETIGEESEKAIREKIAKDKVENNPPTQANIVPTGKGNTLCFEPTSGRYFYSDIDKIKSIENEINRRMLHDISGYASLNEFYDELGLEHTSIGSELGWNVYNLLDIDYVPGLNGDDSLYVVLNYLNRPKYDYYSI